MGNGILDGLMSQNQNIKFPSDTEIEDITIPEKCLLCKNNIICNIMPTLISLLRIGIKISLEECPFLNKSEVNVR